MENYKKYLIIISIVYLLLVSLNIITSINTLERGDNYYHVISAKGILKYNLKPIGDFDIFQHKSDVTLNHPPLYTYFLSLILLIFKVPWALNFVNIFVILLTAVLLVKTTKLIFNKVSDKTLMLVYSLFLFVPLIVQSSYLVDLDVVLGVVMILFVYFYLKNSNKFIINALFFSLIWFIKIQGIPVIVLSLFLFLVFSKKPKKDYLNLLYTLVIGTGVFFSFIYIYAIYFDVSFFRIFEHSSVLDIIMKQISNPKKAFLTSVWTIKQLLIWVTPGMIVLYFLGVYNYVKNKLWKQNEKLTLIILISIITLLELIPIGTYGWNFPKYYAAFIPFMLLSITPLIEKVKINKKDILKIILLFVITTSFFLLIPDPYIPEVSEAFTQKQYLPIIAKVLFNFDLMILPAIFVFIFYKGWDIKKDRNKIYKILLISCMIIFISIGIMQVSKPYSTNNLYGDSHKDLKDTLNYLKENTNPSDKLLLFVHVGYYFGNEDNTNWHNSMLCYNSEGCMLNITMNKEVKFMQFYPKDLERLNGKLKEIIEKEFKYDTQFGDYVIYKRK